MVELAVAVSIPEALLLEPEERKLPVTGAEAVEDREAPILGEPEVTVTLTEVVGARGALQE
jgi:hypothetical protein